MQTEAAQVIGQGSATDSLTEGQLRSIVDEALAAVTPGARVLAIIPDQTRDDNTHLLFPMAARALAARRAGRLDALVAQGTHRPMTDAQKREKIGADGSAAVPGLDRIFDHEWNRPSALFALGVLAEDQVSELTGGLIRESVPARLNTLLSPGMYDLALVFGGTVPHEVAGFSGGAKYFFPGVAGPEITHLTHWLGALTTIEQVIGRVETPTRRVIEAAAAMLTTPVVSFTSVMTRDAGALRTHALFAGEMREALRRAAAVSQRVHVRYTGRTYRRVVAMLDRHYEELWVGGKASYKLGGVIEHGGELIIHAPHMHAISATHGHLIEKYGYAPLERVRDMVDGSDELRANLCVAAHLAHVSYGSARDGMGQLVPRYRITLASSIPEEVCRRVKLGFMDWRHFRRADYEDDGDTLIVDDAGRDLYLVRPPSVPS